MTIVDAFFAQWLQAPADFAVRTDSAATERWGSTAVTAERMTGIARRVDAEAEADRQLAFFAAGPFAIEEHQLLGRDWQREIGRVVTIAIDQLGYDAGLDVFVIGADENRATGLSTVTVIRPLKGLS